MCYKQSGKSPNPRPLQFSLRSFLIFVAVYSILWAWAASNGSLGLRTMAAVSLAAVGVAIQLVTIREMTLLKKLPVFAWCWVIFYNLGMMIGFACNMISYSIPIPPWERQFLIGFPIPTVVSPKSGWELIDMGQIPGMILVANIASVACVVLLPFSLVVFVKRRGQRAAQQS